MNKYIAFLCLLAILNSSCKTTKTKKSTQLPFTQFNTLDTVEISAKPKVYNASATRDFDLLHTSLQVSFDWEKQHLLGQAQLTLVPYFYPQNQLVLDAKGFDIHEINLVQQDTLKFPLQYQYPDSLQLIIQLNKNFTSKDTLQIEIKYTAKPNEAETGGSNAITSDKGLYFINPLNETPNKPQQIWTQGETESSSRWFPTIDKPNEKCTSEICITVGDSMITLSNGILSSTGIFADGTKTDCWVMEQPHAPYLFMMAIGKYAIVKEQWENKEVSYYVEPEYEKYAKNIFGNTPEMIDYFSKKLNVSYPWPKYAQVVVRDFVSGAMENTSASLFLEQIQTTDRERLDRNWDFIIAHELFHQWFGDYVTCESWSNITLNEAFATYGEYLWNEYKYGKDEADYQASINLSQYLRESKIYQEPIIRFYYESREDVFDAHSYQKGGLILHMLRKEVGDEAFFKSLEYYLKNNAYQAVEAHHLRLAFEKITGKDLNWFFNQWFFTSGHPELTFEHTYTDSLKKEIITIIQNKSNDKINDYFNIPLKIDFYTSNGIVEKQILLNDKKQIFEFEFNQKPLAVNIDSDKSLVAKKTDQKEDEEWMYLFYHGKNINDPLEALKILSKKQDDNPDIKDLLKQALQHTHWSVRESAANKLSLDDSTSRADFLEVLKKTALNDQKSQVRYAALKKINTYEKEIKLDIFKKSISDSSYLVAGNTLKLIAEIDTTLAFSYASKMEQETTPIMIDAISSIYANYGKDEKQYYFEKNLKQVSGIGVYYLVINYLDFLLEKDIAIMEKGIKSLHTIARTEENWFIRSEAGLAVYELMKNAEDRIEVNAIKTTDSENEKTLKKIETDKLELFAKNAKSLFEEIKQQEKDEKAIKRFKNK